MRRLVLALATAALALSSCATGRDEARLDLPPALPPPYYVEPGVAVFPGLDQEIFFADGLYWCRLHGAWWEASDPHGVWVRAPARRVPRTIAALPPGRYVRWRPPGRRARAGPPAPAPSAAPAPQPAPRPAPQPAPAGGTAQARRPVEGRGRAEAGRGRDDGRRDGAGTGHGDERGRERREGGARDADGAR